MLVATSETFITIYPVGIKACSLTLRSVLLLKDIDFDGQVYELMRECGVASKIPQAIRLR